MYSSTDEFDTMQLNKLLSWERTRKGYEEYNNQNLKNSGKYKMQTFNLRLDNGNLNTHMK